MYSIQFHSMAKRIAEFATCFFFLLFLSSCSNKKSNDVKPNIIYFLADDIGYGEIGVYGQSIIKTPNIDALAKNGMRFTQHYSGAPVCAPARCILLTGKHAGHAYIRGNDEWAERGDVWNYKAAYTNSGLEGQRPLPESTVTIAQQLQSENYTTGIFGKWGLGAPGSEGVPNKQGFDVFYGYNCQRQAHQLYPSHLWANDKKVLLKNDLISPHEKLDSLLNPNEEDNFAKYTQTEYAPDMIHAEALEFLDDNKESPFFLYYASPLPHLPLQIPSDALEDYKNIMETDEAYLGDKGYFPNRYPRATYAAMISHLDKQLGELVQRLKDLGIYENTIIFFSSDNGPTYTGGVDFEYFESSKPFSNGYGKTKGFVYEGGIRVPFIASWPDKIKAGTSSDHVSSFYDVFSTICDIVGADTPLETDGISFKASLLNESQKEHPYLYWEFPSYKGQQAVRKDNWKAIRKNILDGNMRIELYDLDNDILEENDIANQHPNIVAQMKAIMKKEHRQAENEKFRMSALGDTVEK